MLAALVVKELRESAGLIAIALLTSALFLAGLMNMPLFPLRVTDFDQSFPFVHDPALTTELCLVAGGLALMLGFKQSAWELWHDSYYFLLHRPVDRRSVFGTKLAVGCGVLLVVSGLFIFTYAVWASLPGRHASPFFWSMTIGTWQLWLTFPLLYLGAFLSGIRPGRWFGSRLAPLVAVVPLMILAANLPWWWIGAAIVLLAAATYVASIIHYAHVRDY